MTTVQTGLLDNLIAKADKALTPLTALLELTRRCNLNCRQCYLPRRRAGLVADKHRTELTTARIRQLIDELRRAGCLFLTITGGEPLLHPDFREICRRACDAHLALMLFTNGTLITESIARELARLNFIDVSLSLYGAQPATHDRLTRRPGSFRRTLRGARRLKQAGLNVRFKYLLTNENIREYNSMRALARRWKVRYDLDPLVTPCDNGDSAPTRLRLSDDALKTLYRSLPRTAHISDSKSQPGTCSFGRSHCAINAYGEVYPCLQLPVPAGNLARRSFQDIWQKSDWLKEVRSFSLRKLLACRKCGLVSACRRCPGLNYVETGSIYRPSPETCRQSRYRSIPLNR